MRLDKFLVESFQGTRKQVRLEILHGKVKVNDQIPLDPAVDIDENMDKVEYGGTKVVYPGKLYYMFHKPSGCITARSDEVHKTVFDYMEEPLRKGLFAVGRLDKDTEGLLLLTNDGEFDYQLMHPTHHVEKTYFFWALGTLEPEDVRRIEEGLYLEGEDEITKPAKLKLSKWGSYKVLSKEIPMADENNMTQNSYEQSVVSGYLTITEGRKHQVKRMLKAVGCYVVYLKRCSIGEVTLDPYLEKGTYRPLREEEIRLLRKNKQNLT